VDLPGHDLFQLVRWCPVCSGDPCHIGVDVPGSARLLDHPHRTVHSRAITLRDAGPSLSIFCKPSRALPSLPGQPSSHRRRSEAMVLDALAHHTKRTTQQRPPQGHRVQGPSQSKLPGTQHQICDFKRAGRQDPNPHGRACVTVTNPMCLAVALNLRLACDRRSDRTEPLRFRGNRTSRM
jgi:hypothetical protein